MPCDGRNLERLARQERERIFAAALADLESRLAARSIRVVIGPTGAITFAGWDGDSRQGVTDVCAYRTLTARHSPALAAAVRAAEMLSGRRVNPQQIAAGVHSHDGGATWSAH